MFTQDKESIWDMLSNSEAQYNSLDNAIDYVNLINPALTNESIKNVYAKYIKYCIDNNLI